MAEMKVFVINLDEQEKDTGWCGIKKVDSLFSRIS